MSVSKTEQTFTIGSLAATCGVGLGTIHYYQKIGLIQKPEKPRNGGSRFYSHKDVNRLFLIRNAQTLGLTLKEIASLITHHTNHDCQTVKALLMERANTIRSEIEKLEESSRQILSVVRCCSGNCVKGECTLIASLGGCPLPKAP